MPHPPLRPAKEWATVKSEAAPPTNLLVACMKITTYSQHCSAPFFRALVVYRYQVYSAKGADALIQSAVI
jgi:hypothetical protein